VGGEGGGGPARRREQTEDQKRADSLRRLRRDDVDLLLIHWPDPRVPIAEAAGGLDALRREGLARAIGVSNFSAAQLRQACGVAPIVCNQVSYHLFDRRWEAEMFETAAELGVAVVAYSPLAHGLLSGSLDPSAFQAGDWRARGDTLSSQRLFAPENLAHNLALARRMAQLAAEQKMSMPQAAIAWILAHPQVASVITGSRHVARLRENLGALDVALDAEARATFTALGETAAGLQQEIPVWPVP
jgi:aryl-alcohol dehydrogenase-like predicted oxidoreductase